MEERSPPIIVRRRRKKHNESHGGSWKVAYADFVTAMMAFFLLLWLITMVSPEKRLSVSEYFKSFSVFKEKSASGKSFMMSSPHVMDRSGLGPKIAPKTDKLESMSAEGLVKKLKAAVEEKLQSVKDQILVDVVEGGVRIQIVDLEGSMMFPLGGAEPTARAKEILQLVAENIREMKIRVAIEGHTDAAPFKNAQITNWELSTARASSARKELEKHGIDADRVARVVGYADQEPYVKDSPRDPRNRRISIIVVQAKSEPEAIVPAPAIPDGPLVPHGFPAETVPSRSVQPQSAPAPALPQR